LMIKKRRVDGLQLDPVTNTERHQPFPADFYIQRENGRSLEVTSIHLDARL